MRKKIPKIIIASFISIFIVQMICLAILCFYPIEGQAIEFKPQVPLPGIGTETIDKNTAPIAKYIKAIYVYLIGIVGITATVVMMFGGILWILAVGNASKIEEAKAWIKSSVTGLIIALLSYMILYTVNPALVNLPTSQLYKGSVITSQGCCPGTSSCSNTSSDQCASGFMSGYTCSPDTGKCVVNPDAVTTGTTENTGTTETTENPNIIKKVGCCTVTWGWSPYLTEPFKETYDNKTYAECDEIAFKKANDSYTYLQTKYPETNISSFFNIYSSGDVVLNQSCN